jgi:5'-nucleotidase
LSLSEGVKWLLLALLLVPAVAGAAPGDRFLELYATTDRHGHLEARPAQLGADGASLPVERGGVALLAGYLANARRAAPGRVVLLDAGDMFQGTMVSNLGEGRAVIRAMNALGYAAAAIGNHDFDFGPVGPAVTAKAPGEDPRGALKARAAEARFPLLCANVVDAAGTPLFAPYTVLTVDGVRVGVVGGVSEDLPRVTIRPNLDGLRILPLADAVSRAAAAARAAGATVVVVVVHAGGDCHHLPNSGDLSDERPGDTSGCQRESELFALAHELARRARAGSGGRVDALFGGHTHKWVTAVVDGIPVAQPFPHGLGLAEIALEVDAHGVPTGHFRLPPPVEICSATVGESCDPGHAHGATERPSRYRGQPVSADAAMAALIKPDLDQAAAARAAPVGIHLATPLPRAYGAESPLGNLVADVLRSAAGADLALTNGGGLRADLPAGPLTYGVLFEALPFDNKLATVRLDGATLRRLWTANLTSDKGILSISGARVSARCRGPELEVSITLSDGRPLDDHGIYRVATSDFLALGGDDFAALAHGGDAVQIDDNALLRDLVARALRKRGGALRADDPTIFDPLHRRIELPAPRPLRCR